MPLSTSLSIESDDWEAAYETNPLMGELKDIVKRIRGLKELARSFYFDVLLSRYPCPECGERLKMVATHQWICSCGISLDPTTTFQQSLCCGAFLKKRTCHYACSSCGQNVASRFLFDERVFDKAYFRERMAASRRKKAEKREEIRRMLAASRSDHFQMAEALDLEGIPGLTAALDEFVSSSFWDSSTLSDPVSEFSLETYRRHLIEQLSWDPIQFSALSPYSDDFRRDRVRRFITLIFMEQAREVALKQSGADIWVQKVYHEVDDQG